MIKSGEDAGNRLLEAAASIDSYSNEAGNDADVELPAAAIVALNRGQIIEAIKLTREARPGLGLKEAKDRVDAYVERDPMLKASVEQQRSDARRKLVRWVLAIDVLLVALAIWYFFLR